MVRDGLRMAVGTLTALPVPAPTSIDRRVAGTAMAFAPLAGVVLAAAAGLVVGLGVLVGLPALVVAVLGLGTVALATRGLHLDGLADTADGLGASYDRERALEIMRRGDAGPTGVATLLFVVLLQVGALAAAISAGVGVVAIVVAVIASRVMVPLCCTRFVPSARPEGLGATVSGAVAVPIAAGIAVAVAAVSTVALFAGLAWWQGPVAVVVGWCVAAVLLARCIRRLGGMTGDVLGGCVEVSLAATLAILAV
ncbi:adenosylcobinamide-GDP ribazoletransferase [Saccharomonospora sp. CUA-673]|uniref:adenosylcobinamide-GDP ribazoletransferase n=1 Tax=Saccharomonospora sp. CUA-673 TaxID=1904969 RepID=UPI000960A5D7|nr:adenosylcobinamide-GDP ribazoletransferase [Saccharomonospora sp. CUA-673]OLT44578.1 adenosylcobinamide-GDP ribazoletransferase [Saccharomonospora sp. CUA-673]